MTVEQLIEALKELPKDVEVEVYDAYRGESLPIEADPVFQNDMTVIGGVKVVIY